MSLVPLFAFAQVISLDPEPPKATPTRYSEAYIVNEIEKVWGANSADALKIAKCESVYNNLAVNYEDSKLNGHVSRGLFQMSEINGVIPLWWEPRVNAEKAYQLFQRSGWDAWRNCARANGLL